MEEEEEDVDEAGIVVVKQKAGSMLGSIVSNKFGSKAVASVRQELHGCNEKSTGTKTSVESGHACSIWSQLTDAPCQLCSRPSVSDNDLSCLMSYCLLHSLVQNIGKTLPDVSSPSCLGLSDSWIRGIIAKILCHSFSTTHGGQTGVDDLH